MPGRDAPPPPIPALDPLLDPPEASPRSAALIVGLGVAFDLALNGQQPGISIPILVALVALGLRTVARRSIETDLLLVAAVVVSCFCAVRADPDLIALDVLTAAGALAMAATQDAGSIFAVSLPQLVRRATAIPQRAIEMPHYLVPPIARAARLGRTGSRPLVRAVALVVPIVAIFAAILASGDRVFARLLGRALPDWNAERFVSHVIVAVVGTALVAILWRITAGDRRASTRPEPAPRLVRRLFSFSETITVLIGILSLFTAFVVVQFAYMFGGRNRVLVSEGLTYAEYARSGFFQLAAAAALTAIVILGAWDLTRYQTAGERRWFRRLTAALIGLTGVILTSAIKRLALYEDTFGFTVDRFSGYVAIAVIGGILAVLLGAIVTGRRDRVIFGTLAVGLAALLTVNVLGPDRFVAERNLARFRATGKIDVSYVATLGPDAFPVIVRALPLLPRLEAETIRHVLCQRLDELGRDRGWRSFNAGRSEARTALARAQISPPTCDKPAFAPS